MSKKRLIRVAFVKFSEHGKTYPTRCDREDIREGNEVEVLMRANSADAYYMDGTIESIAHHRWNCTCRVMNLTSEVEYTIADDFTVDRKVNLPAAPVYSIADRREKKRNTTKAFRCLREARCGTYTRQLQVMMGKMHT